MNVVLPPPRTIGEPVLLSVPPLATVRLPSLTKSLTLAVPLTVMRPALVLAPLFQVRV